MLKTISIENDKGQMDTWSVTIEKETDDEGNVTKILILKNGDEIRRLSPNTTEDELLRYADPNEKGYQL